MHMPHCSQSSWFFRPGTLGTMTESMRAIVDAKRPDVHAFAAHADAAITEDAARAIVKDGRRPLLLVAMVLDLDELAFACAVLEGHVLQLALAAGVADGAVERVIAEEQFDGGLARLRDFGRLGDEDLALGDGGGAGGLQLGNFFLAHDAHAAGGLQREAGIVAERGNLDAGLAAGVNEQRSRGCGELFSVDCEGYVGHFVSFKAIFGLRESSRSKRCHPELESRMGPLLRSRFL
jgi:hypothetical protein